MPNAEPGPAQAPRGFHVANGLDLAYRHAKRAIGGGTRRMLLRLTRPLALVIAVTALTHGPTRVLATDEYAPP